MAKPEILDGERASYAAPWAMMASNSYGDRFNFDLAHIGWKKVDRHDRPCTVSTFRAKFTGLAYDIYKNNDGDVAMAFRGTNSKWDWFVANFAFPFSIHYWSAFKHFRIAKEKYGDKLKTVTGHSLGGGIALGVSVRYGIDAVAFDPSPRIFDGLGDHHQQAKRWVILQMGDPLHIARRFWSKFHQVVNDEDVSICNYEFGKFSRHRADLLAAGIVKQAAPADPRLGKIVDSLPAPLCHIITAEG